MAGEVLAGLSAIKTAFDMAQGLQNIHDAVARDRAVIELQKEILAAQSAQAALLERVGKLEKQVADFETWEATKKRYDLKKLPPGTYVYELKQGVNPPEELHYACAKCFEHRKRSILHGHGMEQGLETFRCHECGTDFVAGKFQSTRRDGDDGGPTYF